VYKRQPVAYLIPCHRVLRANGGIGGYHWGTTRKRAILAREAACLQATSAAGAENGSESIESCEIVMED